MDLAEAYLCKMAEPEMCVTKMREQALKKANAFISTIPQSIAIDKYKTT